MNGCREDSNSHCYFHPKQLVVGICALCLRERLLALASKQDQQGPETKDGNNRFFRTLSRPPVITLPKVFALGSLLHLLDHSRHPRSKDDRAEDDTIGSLEERLLYDSFISIKFEDNGRASWHQKAANADATAAAATNGGAACAASGINRSGTEASKGVVELPKRGAGALRWRKRIGHLLQLARWRRSSKAVAGHVGFEGAGAGKGVKRRGWMRSLTRRRTTAAATTTSSAFAVDAVD